MKILCSQFSNALYHIFTGFKNVFEACGHEFYWLPKNFPVFDAFDKIKPDIYIGETYNITDSHIKCFKHYNQTKIVLKGNNWGDLDVDIEKYPIGVASDLEKLMIEKLINETGKPDLIFNFYHKNWIEPTMGLWRNIGCKVVGLQPAADTFTYYNTHPIKELLSDICFVGGYWKYKSEHLNWLVKLCNPVGKYNIKIVGNQPWPVVQYLGSCNDIVCNNLLNSAQICPNLSEPHAMRYGFEVNERVFKLAYAKCFCISDYIESLVNDTFVNSAMVTVKSDKEFKREIDYYLNNPESKKEHVEACYNIVKENDTYWERVSHLFESLGFDEESDNIKIKKVQHVK